MFINGTNLRIDKVMRRLLLCVFFLIKLAFASDFIPAWQAFQLSVEAESTQRVWVKFDIAPEYHIYQNKIKIQTLETSSVKLGNPLLPDPLEINAPNVGKFKVYEGKVAIQVPVTYAGNGDLDLTVSYQGCKNVELCYPEQQVSEHLDLFHPKEKVVITDTPTKASSLPIDRSQPKASLTDLVKGGNQQKIASWFTQSPWLVISGFFVVGLLLAFTPCVFPMLPVLIGVIAGHNISLKRSFSLAFSYILGGAFLYSLAGVVAASLGYSLANYLQASWVSYLVASLFLVFSLSLFGIFELRLPLNLQNKLNFSISKFKHRSLVSSFILGGLANLVLSPCVTGPLAGALIYISTTGNKLLGALSLFALGLGSGVPLLIIAVFGKGLLPKAGNWLYIVKSGLALLMLLMSIYMLSKVVVPSDLNWLISIWILVAIWFVADWVKLNQYKTVIMLCTGIGLLYWVTNHNRQLIARANPNSDRPHVIVKNMASLKQALTTAKLQGKQVILDYYADWCVACKEMEINTFSDPRVKQLINNYSFIRVDITANDIASENLLKEYNIIAPPSLVFIDKDGNDLEQAKIVGYVDGDKLSTQLQQLTKAGN